MPIFANFSSSYFNPHPAKTNNNNKNVRFNLTEKKTKNKKQKTENRKQKTLNKKPTHTWSKLTGTSDGRLDSVTTEDFLEALCCWCDDNTAGWLTLRCEAYELDATEEEDEELDKDILLDDL